MHFAQSLRGRRHQLFAAPFDTPHSCSIRDVVCKTLVTTEEIYGTLEDDVAGSTLSGMVKRQPHGDIVRFLDPRARRN